MNLNQRRPTGTHINRFVKHNKSDVLHLLSQHGCSLRSETVDKGEWNQRKNYWVHGDESLHFAFNQMKGERLDWNQIHDDLEKILSKRQ